MHRVILVLSSFVAILATSSANSNPYFIPEPLLEVYASGGFKISIPHVDGMQLFAFHGNVNRPLSDASVGQYYGDVVYPECGKWSFEEVEGKLRNGDKLNYWVYVVYGRVGYRKRGEFNVTEYAQKGPKCPDIPNTITTVPTTTERQGSIPNSEAAGGSNSEAAPGGYNTNLASCERNVYLLLGTLLKTESQLEPLQKENAIMRNALDKIPGGRTLKLSGSISRSDPLTVVKFILYQKLDLRPTIVAVRRMADYSIQFDLATVDDFLAVLARAEDKLENSSTVKIELP